jgi:hypothetical protein
VNSGGNGAIRPTGHFARLDGLDFRGVFTGVFAAAWAGFAGWAVRFT